MENENKKAVYDLYGRIDLTKLGDIVRQHPELVKTYTDKNGVEHKCLNINVYSKDKDDYGNVAYVKVPCKPASMKLPKGAYYVCDLKLVPDPNASHTGGSKYEKREDYVPEGKTDKDDLPF